MPQDEVQKELKKIREDIENLQKSITQTTIEPEHPMVRLEKLSNELQLQRDKLVSDRLKAFTVSAVFGATAIFIFNHFYTSHESRMDRYENELKQRLHTAIDANTIVAEAKARIQTNFNDENKRIFFSTTLANLYNLRDHLLSSSSSNQFGANIADKSLMVLELDYLINKYAPKLEEETFSLERAKALSLVSYALTEFARARVDTAKQLCIHAEKIDPTFPEASYTLGRLINFEKVKIREIDIAETKHRLETEQDNELRLILKTQLTTLQEKRQQLTIEQTRAFAAAYAKAKSPEEICDYGSLPAAKALALLTSSEKIPDLQEAIESLNKELIKADGRHVMPRSLLYLFRAAVEEKLISLYDKRTMKSKVEETKALLRESYLKAVDANEENYIAANNYIWLSIMKFEVDPYQGSQLEPDEISLKSYDIQQLQRFALDWEQNPNIALDSGLLHTHANLLRVLSVLKEQGKDVYGSGHLAQAIKKMDEASSRALAENKISSHYEYAQEADEWRKTAISKIPEN